MKKKKFSFEAEIFDNLNDLPTEDFKLYKMAISAADDAYAPYSNFKVGAAVLLANGEIITANNQENGAYPSGLCAERVALFYAMAKFKDVVIEKMAVVAKSDDYNISSPVSPCGACRQVIAEYELKQAEPIRMIFGGVEGEVFAVEGIRTLLPFVFDMKSYNK